MVDVGGYRLSATVTGDGEPPVVYLDGFSVADDDGPATVPASEDWLPVLAELRHGTMSVHYYRPGTGLSDPLPADQVGTMSTPAATAEELGVLLDGLGVPRPVVLVGHSLGGLIAQSYARRWPGEIGGLVLLDTSDWRLGILDSREEPPLRRPEGRGGRLFNFAASDPRWDPRPEPDCPTVVVTAAVGRWLDVPTERAPTAFTLPEADHLWQSWQRETAMRLDAPQVIAHTAGHNLHREAPALVAYVIDAVVEAARNGDRRPRLDPVELDNSGGRLVSWIPAPTEELKREEQP
jgi:pimeloyl-ACP methyl ester carboxylesterase